MANILTQHIGYNLLIQGGNMKREILFRAKFFGSWRYGSYVHFDKKPTHNCYNCNYKDFIVTNEEYGEHYYPITELSSIGQYVGLEDHKGVRLFEGDILESRGERFVIEYSNDLAALFAYNTKYPNRLFMIEKRWVNGYNKMVIIGNVTDNPELIK